MGGTGSTRRLVVEEIDGDGVVKISESVVRRLKGESEPEGASSSQSKSAPRPERVFLPPPPPQYGQARIDSKKAVQEVEAFYQQKLRQLEERNATLQKITNEQFAKAVQEVEQKFLKQTGSPVCQDLQSRVYNCYVDNPKYTLRCSADVRAFSLCVETARQNALARKG
ncbi:MICOS complex subunit MIC19-like [Haliotis rufescens]|uniref:MICOS complex subunit MIC19-like n=1 Tax=Haliotis rufescens TaxID=6454 RepID=UPI001EAFE31D|nr:MICOS complex subunit MIC19-like [Haliotis rufescens]